MSRFQTRGRRCIRRGGHALVLEKTEGGCFRFAAAQFSNYFILAHYPDRTETKTPSFPTPVLIAFHKPYGVLSQFTPEPGSSHRTLGEFGFPSGVYPIGRLDADSEGLLLLSDEPEWNRRLLTPGRGHPRTYWSQVEGIPLPADLARLEKGIRLRGESMLPCIARILDPQPDPPPREPPIRIRRNIPTTWIELRLVEGKNRQVRRMTAGIGHPTLRLIRVRMGDFPLGNLEPGKWNELTPGERKLITTDIIR